MSTTRTFLLTATAGAFVLGGCTTERADPGLEDSPPTEAAAEIEGTEGFDAYDVDADRRLNREEFGQWAEETAAWDRWRDTGAAPGMASGEDFDRMVEASWDFDRDAAITQEEWTRATGGDEGAFGEWQAWDTDGDGQLGPAELRQGVERQALFAATDLDEDTTLSDEEITAYWFTLWDADGDGHIDPQEWRFAEEVWEVDATGGA